MTPLWWIVLALYVLGGFGTVGGLVVAGRRAAGQHASRDKALKEIERLVEDAGRRQKATEDMDEHVQISQQLDADLQRELPMRLTMATIGYAADYAERTLYAELKAPAALAIAGVALGTLGSVLSLWL